MNCNCECRCKEEFSDEFKAEIDLIESVVEAIEESDMCPACLRNILYSLYTTGKEIGWSDHRDYITSCNED